MRLVLLRVLPPPVTAFARGTSGKLLTLMADAAGGGYDNRSPPRGIMAMSQPDLAHRISQIHTLWTVVGRAGGDGTTHAVNAAQEQLLERYGKAVYRYLLGAIRDSDVADELYQEFALRFVRGDLAGADPARGRFRDYLKGVLSHLVGDHYRRKRKQPLALNPEY